MMAIPIVSRQQWGARPPKQPGTPWRAGQPTGWTVHWEGADPAGGAHSQCAAAVRSIQAYHQSGPYSDIAYSFVVCRHGSIYEGRGFKVQSAANNKGNDERLAVCFMGGPNTPFTAEAKSAIRHLIFDLSPASAKGKAIGHRDEPSCSTACPGDSIEAWIKNGMGAPPVPVPAPPVPARHPLLRQGSRGPAVMELQRKLNASVQASPIAVDGIFGPATAARVRRFQQTHSLAADGIAGPATWAVLDAEAHKRGVR
jgi:hypothetical protein